MVFQEKEILVDMHCHCLPGIDDGAANMEESIEMLQQAYDDGIRFVIATPHFHHRRGHASKEVILSKIEEVREEVKQRWPDMEIYPGNELFYGSRLVGHIDAGDICTMAGSKYVLVEFSPDTEYVEIRNALIEIQAQDVWPILAHVERYYCMVKKPSLVMELADMGIYIQVNADGVLGKYGWKEKQMIKKLFKAGRISFVATDAHDTKKRKQQLSDCAQYIKKKYGSEVMQDCFFNNPQAVINNKLI